MYITLYVLLSLFFIRAVYFSFVYLLISRMRELMYMIQLNLSLLIIVDYKF